MRRLGEEVQGVAGGGLDVGFDAEGAQERAHGGGELAEEVDEGAGGFEADGVVVEDGSGFFVDLGRLLVEPDLHVDLCCGKAYDGEGTHLLVDCENCDALYATFGVRLRIEIFILALAVEWNLVPHHTLGCEVEAVDALTCLLRQLQELECLSRLEEHSLVAGILVVFRKDDLETID